MVNSVVLLGGLGFVLSTILSLVYARLGVKLSEIEKCIRAVLPGVNCGGCGFPGCDGYASALAKGESEPGLCPVMDEKQRVKLSEVLGLATDVWEREPKVAVIRCAGGNSCSDNKVEYVGLSGCTVSRLVAEGPRSCRYGCIGFGDCVLVCQFDAIKMGADGLPIIDDKRCTGCGMCVSVCCQELIEVVPKAQKVYVGCSSFESVKLKRVHCKVACTGCKLCEKSCPYEAIKVDGVVSTTGVGRVNFEFCRNCGICVAKCPTGAIVDKLKSRPKSIIGAQCTGCEKCKEVCPMDAITGERAEQHRVDFSKCIGCSLCHKVCESEAITMAFSLGYSE